jgi:L-asparaginase
MQVIYVVSTGGTIEKVYSEQTGSVENLDSKIDRYLQMLRLPDSEVRVIRLMNKDSLEMTDADRTLISETVEKLLPRNCPDRDHAWHGHHD